MNEVEIDTPTTEWNSDDDKIVQYLNKYGGGHSQWIEKVEKILKDRCIINGTFTKISKLPLNSESDMSILHTAMELKSEALMIKMMCKYIDDIDCRNTKHQTPLHIGMIADHTIGLNILHDKKADINAKDNYGIPELITTIIITNYAYTPIRLYSNHDQCSNESKQLL